MSLILDALNRAEHERKNKNAVPDINTVHALPVVAPSANANPKSRLFGVVVVCALLIMIVVVWLFYAGILSVKKTASVAESSALTPVVNADSVSAQLPTQSTMPVTTQSPSVPIENSPAVESLYAQQASSAPVVTADVEQLYEPEEAAPVSESVVTPFATEEAAAPVVEPVVETKPQRHFADVNEIDFNDLAWNQRQQIPTISYARHNYFPNNVSTVMINGETLGEGNALAGGQLIVVEIFVDGVVLNFRGNKFKLRALSGWVNM